MNGGRSLSLTPKFRAIYNKLLQGSKPSQISPNDSEDAFFSHLFSLDVDRAFLLQKLNEPSKSAYLGYLKPLLNTIFLQCVKQFNAAQKEDVRRAHCLETLQISLRCMFNKNMSGWEVMEVMAGGVGQSDEYFMNFVVFIEETIVDTLIPARVRHQALQVALIYMCGIGQLSPGAYFLRRNLFPSIATFIKTPDTEQFTFEASLLLALLANYHKSDAAKLNPYLQRIRQVDDKDLIRQICWASDYALQAAIKAYQEVSDDSPPTFTSTLASMVISMRPDRALASKPLDPPRELFKSLPIEATAVLLLLFEFTRTNSTFNSVLIDYLSPDLEKPGTSKPIHGRLPLTILTLSSYLITHASSTASPRAAAYANLCLNVLLAFVENGALLRALTPPVPQTIRLCRQNGQTRLEYHWGELWRALCGLLEFLVAKQDSLATTGGVEQLSKETILCIYLSLYRADHFLPTPRLIHEFIYELVRSLECFRKLAILQETLAVPQSPGRRGSNSFELPIDRLGRIIATLQYYEEKIQTADARSAKAALRVLAGEVNRDGVHGTPEQEISEPSKQLDDVLTFARYACADGLSLMP
ncbi:hypothetical protein CCMSSC00406_0002864 [Pleurotus cornucopiae]|uniref:Uncharacterized protein n=1 Tax=Pleurotus cornucopiae TaxID=5321 RepID=A0ACB7IXQ6_PLECO|nr:hypothetical protein CCMSSC00406_0002864 [Pleurotus cornucopiae]